jgi:hypothetical protein
MSSKIKEKVLGNNKGEIHITSYEDLVEKSGKVKEKITGGNNGEFHKAAYEDLMITK